MRPLNISLYRLIELATSPLWALKEINS